MAVKFLRDRDEIERFDKLMDERHYLGDGGTVGDYLRQVAMRGAEWVGLLAWGSACYAIQDRDLRIGWPATLRAERQKLVVQNRRFLLLNERGAEPNLASRVLGAAVRVLPGQWHARFGYTPLLAETFTDIEAFAGTCYKAAGWEAVGKSKGYSRHRADFYVPNGRPKKLWLKPLRPDAYALLCAAALPPECRAGAASNAHGVMPLKAAQIESLSEALRRVPDPRASNRLFLLSHVLSIVAMAMLCGHRDISSMVRFGHRLTQAQRRALGLPRKRDGKFYRVPGYKVYYMLLRKLDLDAFAQVLSDWLTQRAGELPGALALDGKMVRDTIGVVALVDAEDGVARAMAPMSAQDGEGHRSEVRVARKLIESYGELGGRMISMDALHASAQTMRTIARQGGDALVQVKGNRPKTRKAVEQAFDKASPFLS